MNKLMPLSQPLQLRPRLIASFLFLATLEAGLCQQTYAQQQSSSDYHQRLSLILDVISDGPHSESDPFIQRSKSFLETHARYHEALAEDRKVRLDKASQIYEDLISRFAKSEAEGSDGTVAVNIETAELLLRECLLELQRLDWEAATEESVPNVQLAEQKANIAQLKLQNKQLSLESLRQKLAIAKESFNSLLERRNSGTYTGSEFDDSALRLTDIQSQVEQTEMEIKTIMGELKLQLESDTQLRAENQNRIQRKREVLRKQIEQLKAERTRARNAEVLLDQSARHRKHIAELSEEISKNELRASETRTLLRFIQDALQKDLTNEKSQDKK